MITIATFPSELGWMAVLWRGPKVRQVVFGHRSSSAAERCLDVAGAESRQLTGDMANLVARLQQFAQGIPQDFKDLTLAWPECTRFQRTAWRKCRLIAYGNAVTYGELARRVGSPRSARAVGKVMARNPMPLIVPCHRVVAADGRMGGFSAPGGLDMKRRLLQLEQTAELPRAIRPLVGRTRGGQSHSRPRS